MHIELSPHIGTTTSGKVIEAGFDNILVVEAGRRRHVGMVFDRDNGPIHLIVFGLSEHVKAQIRKMLGIDKILEPCMPPMPLEVIPK